MNYLRINHFLPTDSFHYTRVLNYVSFLSWVFTSWIDLIQVLTCWLLKLCVLETSTVISGWLLTCDSAHSWQFYSAAQLEDQISSALAGFPTQSHYPDTELTSLGRRRIIQGTRLDSDKCQFG